MSMVLIKQRIVGVNVCILLSLLAALFLMKYVFHMNMWGVGSLFLDGLLKLVLIVNIISSLIYVKKERYFYYAVFHSIVFLLNLFLIGASKG